MIAASLWMIVITVALFFLPLVNGLIGGAVGGYKAGTPGRGLSAAVLPALVVAAALWLVLGLLDAPLVGFLAAMATGVIILLSEIGMLIGAAVGGFLASRRPEPLHPV